MPENVQTMEKTASIPVHEQVYRRLRDMVLFGDLAPGQAITIQGLAGNLDAGMTPVREAIRRLIAEGALQMQGNRRVCVPLLDASQIEELAFARLAIEPELARRASKHVTDETLDFLARIDADLDAAITAGNLRAYLRLNYEFHHGLYGLAGAPVLLDLAEKMWLQFGPSLRTVMDAACADTMPDCHKTLLAALGDGDGPAAATAVHLDILQGVERVRGGLAATVD